jgi:hypothetical protein
VLAPLGESVKLCPTQMVPLLTVIVGFEFTVTCRVLALADVHPEVLVPVTEYMAVEGGDIVLLPLE